MTQLHAPSFDRQFPGNQPCAQSFSATSGASAEGVRPGLVEQATTHTFYGRTKRQALRELAKERRLRWMRKGVTAHAEATRTEIEQGGCYYAIMVTATYRPGVEYLPEHVTALVNHMRNYARRRRVMLRYQWVIELQQRGAPHYHLLIWVPEDFRFPKPDAQGWWPHGSTRIERARGAVGYLVKYVSKGNNESFSMPHGCRLFGTGGGCSARLARHRAGLPRWLTDKIPPTSKAKRVPFAGWLCVDTGEILETPFTMRWEVDKQGNAVLFVIERLQADVALVML